MEKVTFSGVRLESFGRNPKKGGFAKFRSAINDHVRDRMGWPDVDDRLTDTYPEGDLAAQTVELVPKDKELRQHSMTIEAQRVHGFEIVRRELEEKKGKGYRHELLFQISFTDPLGCAKLEQYIQSACGAPKAKAALIVSYRAAAAQEELPIGNVTASDEQRQAVLEDAVQ